MQLGPGIISLACARLIVPFAPFNVSQLELVLVSWIPNYTNPSLPPIKIDENLKFEVVQVLDSKLNKQRKDLLLYYVC